MRSIKLALAFGLAVAGVAQGSVAMAQTAVAGATYNTADYDLGTLIDNPQTKAVLEKYIAQMINSDQITMARGMTLRQIQQYASEVLTNDKLAAIDADLAKIPVKK